MKKIISVILYLFISYSFLGQSNIDSLYNVINSTTEISNKAEAHNKLAWFFINNDISVAKAHLDTSLVLFTSIKDKNGIALCNYKYGVLYRVSGDFIASLNYMNKYLSYVVSQQDSLNVANSQYQKGVVYSLQGDYENSLKEYYKTLLIYEALEDSTSIGFTLNSIGIVYKNLKKYPQAIENYQKAVIIHKKSNDLENLANVYNSLGSVYAEQKNYDKALEFFNKTLEIDIKTKNNWGIAINNMDIGSLYFEKQQYKKALKHYFKSYNLQLANNFTANITRTLIKISATYLLLGDYNKSEFYLKEASDYLTSSNEINKEYHFQSYTLFEKLGKSKKALYHYKKYSVFKDSIFNKENIKNINLLEIQYNTQKKDKEILQQQLVIEKTEKELQKKLNQSNFMIGISIFLFIISILIWFVFQQRQKRKNQEIISLKREHQIKTLESLMEGEEKERFRIAKELHDGVNGDLSAIKYKLSSLSEMNNKVINEAIAMIDSSCSQVRAISHNLVPPSLENFNLIEAIQDYCSGLDAVQPVPIIFQYLGESISISKKAEVNIFRIIQELVSNSIKHASASEINVQMSCRDKNIQITVEDNGKGFNTNNIQTKGIGLKNIESRIEYLQASIDIVSNKHGTSTTVEIDTQKLNDN